MTSQVSIVRASAGSGKTHALAKQYIRLLLAPSGPPAEKGLQSLREILAITFTNKASLQMKERILDFLKKIAFDKFETQSEKEDILSCLGRKDYREKAAALMDIILRNYHFFMVETIDSFIKSLLSSATFKMNFSPSFRIVENYGENLAYSLDRIIEKTETDKKVMDAFGRFLEQYLYAENQTNWFLKRDIFSLMEIMFHFGNVYGGRFGKSGIESKDLILKKRAVLKNIKKIRGTAPEGTNKTFIKSLDSFLAKTSDVFDIDNLPNAFSRDEFPVNKGYPVPAGTDSLWSEIKKQLCRVCEIESASFFNPYIDIFDMVSVEFNMLASEDDAVFLEELNRRAGEIIEEDSVNVSELYYRLATRLRHYLIDEFQDTSLLQWRNLNPLIKEAISTGGTFFCVGDVKQAIYRFRGGDISLLQGLDKRFKEFNPETRILNTNFRSRREIVEFNNRIFAQENMDRFLGAVEKGNNSFTEKEIKDIKNAFADSGQTFTKENTGGYVKIEYIDAADTEESEQAIKCKITGLVKKILERFSGRDVAILTRDNKEAELVTKWLLGEGIAVESAKTLNIKEHPHIKELVSFLKFLNSPIDNLSFASFIMGDIFTRATGIKCPDIRDFLFHTGKRAVNEYFYKAFRQKFPAVWNNLIEKFFKRVGYMPLYEFTVDILSGFNVTGNFPQYQGFYMKFLELIKEQEEMNFGIAEFLDSFDKLEGEPLYVKIVDSRNLKVLTVHKAKGLEFPVVIIPFLAIDAKIGSGGEFRRSFVVYPGTVLEMKRLKKKYGLFSEKLGTLYREEYRKSCIDELNNIYVAFTRAKDELYIFAPQTTLKKNAARMLLGEGFDKKEFGAPAPAGADRKSYDKMCCREIPPSRHKEWMPFLKDEFKNIAQIKNREKMRKGEAFHYLLSLIGNLSRNDKKSMIKTALEKTLLKFPYIGGLKEVARAAEALLENKKISRFFFVKDASVFQEKEIISNSRESLRIDRLIVKEDRVEVIDYKSSRDEIEQSRVQIKKYINAVGNLYRQKKIKGYLVFLDDFGVEEI